MAGNADAESRYSVNIDSNAAEVGPNAARELEGMRQRIVNSQSAVKELSSSLRLLRGTTAEVAAQKEQLQARLNAERDAISAANLALLKQGTSYEKVAAAAKKLEAQEKDLAAQVKQDSAAREAAQKKLADELKSKAADEAKERTESLSAALRVAGGPIAGVVGHLKELKAVTSGAGGAFGVFVLAAAAATAAVVALISKAVDLSKQLGEFIVRGADAARNMNLVRLAMSGTQENARNLGTQVDRLADQVSTPKEELNKLGAELARTRLSGRAIVDTFETVSRASDAMGDDVGSSLKEIITRGQLFNRFQLNPLELQGKGVRFDDVAGELAGQLKIGINEARARLFEGRVTIDQGAKAMAAAANKRFGEINAAKLLSLDVQAQKFKEHLAALTAGVNLEPLLRGLREVGKIFDTSSVAGAELKAIFTSIGNTLGATFEKNVPLIRQFVKGAIIGALEVGIAFLKLGKTAKQVLVQDLGDYNAANLAKDALGALAKAVDVLRFALAAANGVLYPFIAGTKLIFRADSAGAGAIESAWKAMGEAMPAGAAAGIREGAPSAVREMQSFARDARGAFAADLEIHSPSRVFKTYGQQTAAGYEEGVEEGSPGTARALDGMVETASPAGAAGSSGSARSSGGGAGVSVQVGPMFIGAGGGSPEQVKRAVESPALLVALTKTIEDFLTGQGLPIQGVPAR